MRKEASLQEADLNRSQDPSGGNHRRHNYDRMGDRMADRMGDHMADRMGALSSSDGREQGDDDDDEEEDYEMFDPDRPRATIRQSPNYTTARRADGGGSAGPQLGSTVTSDASTRSMPLPQLQLQGVLSGSYSSSTYIDGSARGGNTQSRLAPTGTAAAASPRTNVSSASQVTVVLHG